MKFLPLLFNMAKQGRNKPKYSDGAVVFCTITAKEETIHGEPKWNGFTFLYNLKGIADKCSESNLRSVLKPKT